VSVTGNQEELKPLRTAAESEAAAAVVRLFESSADSVATRLDNFPKYVRRQSITRFLALYEVFKMVLPVKGSIVECGVNNGFGLMTWAKLSAILEPVNLTRRIYGFDTFEGFPTVHAKDAAGAQRRTAKVGQLASDSYAELIELARHFDADRFLGHVDKVHVQKGDATRTIPAFARANPHLIVSLLFLDFDLYEPTIVAIKQLLPRMPRGAVIAFDELDNPIWPGETQALLDAIGIGRLELRRFEFDPYIAFATIP